MIASLRRVTIEVGLLSFMAFGSLAQHTVVQDLPGSGNSKLAIGRWELNERARLSFSGEKIARFTISPDGNSLALLTGAASDVGKKQKEVTLRLKMYALPVLKLLWEQPVNYHGMAIKGVLSIGGGEFKGELSVESVAFSPDSKHLAICESGKERVLKIFEAATGKVVAEQKLPKQVQGLALDWERWRLAISEEQDWNDRVTKPVKIFDLRNAAALKSLDAPEIEKYCGSLSPNPWTCSPESADPIGHLLFLPNGYLLTSTVRGRVYLWDVDKGEIRRHLIAKDPVAAKLGKALGGFLTDYAMSPEGDYWVTNDRSGHLTFWRMPNLEWAAETPGLGASNIGFSRGGNFIAVKGWKGNLGSNTENYVYIWNVLSRTQLGPVRVDTGEHSYAVQSYFFTPDEKYFVVCRYGKDLKPEGTFVYSLSQSNMTEQSGQLPKFWQAGFGPTAREFYIVSEDQTLLTGYESAPK